MPGVAFTVLAIILILLRRASGLPDSQPSHLLLTNLAVFLDPRTTPRFLYSLAASVDCVFFWELSLTALGLKAARVASNIANWSVVSLWLLYAVAQAAWIEQMGH